MNKAGDIILTRNPPDVGNPTLGYWNHAAISSGEDIIEAQSAPNSVIRTPFKEFRARYPELVVLRYADEGKARKAAAKAKTIVGSLYNRVASFFFRRSKKSGEYNCVAVVRDSWQSVLNKNLRWTWPDTIYRTRARHGFVVVEDTRPGKGVYNENS